MKKLMKGLALVLALSFLMVSAMAEEAASGFTPSATYKGVPEIRDDSGMTGIGGAYVLVGGCYIVTPVSMVGEMSIEEINDRLARACVNVRDYYSVGDLKAWEEDYTKRVYEHEDEVTVLLEASKNTSIDELHVTLEYETTTRPADDAVATLAAPLNALLASMELELTADDLAVRDLLDLHAVGTYFDYMQEEGSYVDVEFKLDIPENDLLIVLYSDDGEYWQILPQDYVSNNADGFVQVHMEHLGVYAFTVEAY